MKDNENVFFLEEILSKKRECKILLEEVKSLNKLLEEDIKELNELIGEIEIDYDIFNIPKFKGQSIFENYLKQIENKKTGGKIIDKKKIRGVVEKNEIIKAQKDINRLKQMVSNK